MRFPLIRVRPRSCRVTTFSVGWQTYLEVIQRRDTAPPFVRSKTHEPVPLRWRPRPREDDEPPGAITLAGRRECGWGRFMSPRPGGPLCPTAPPLFML